ncbi:MAG: DUF4270 domain-containing protein [Bacteroidales bacterium]
MKTNPTVRTAFFISVIFFIVIGCSKKPESLIGLDLLGDGKPFVGFDTTLSVLGYSQIEDSVISDELSYNQLGSMLTPAFGLTNASLFMHLRLASLNPDFGTNPVSDSIIFSMVYEGSYGNLNTQQNFRVFPVTEDFYIDSTYWSNAFFTIDDSKLFANYNFIPDLSDQMVIDTSGGVNDTSYLTASLRIPFDNTFAETIFTLDPQYFASNDAFKDGFKGIYIRPEHAQTAGEGAILSFDLLDIRSDLTIYYKPDPDSAQRTFRFIINSNNARVARYEHDYSLSTDQNFINQVINGDTTLGSEKLYLQGLGGVQTVIKIPGLNDLAATGNIIINEARLVLQTMESSEYFGPTERLVMFKFNENKLTEFLPDQLQGDGYFGGSLQNTSGSYWFRISLHSQNMINGETDFGLVIYPTGKSIRANETVLYGSEPSQSGHLRLEVIYTRIN